MKTITNKDVINASLVEAIGTGEVPVPITPKEAMLIAAKAYGAALRAYQDSIGETPAVLSMNDGETVVQFVERMKLDDMTAGEMTPSLVAAGLSVGDACKDTGLKHYHLTVPYHLEFIRLGFPYESGARIVNGELVEPTARERVAKGGAASKSYEIGAVVTQKGGLWYVSAAATGWTDMCSIKAKDETQAAEICEAAIVLMRKGKAAIVAQLKRNAEDEDGAIPVVNRRAAGCADKLFSSYARQMAKLNKMASASNSAPIEPENEPEANIEVVEGE